MARDRAARPEARPLRLFVAVDVPETVRARLTDAVAPIRERFPRGRWSPVQNWHVTMKFLGATWPRLVDWVMESVAGVASAHVPFETSVEGLGAFPSPRRARVLWAGLSDPGGRFAALAGALEGVLARDFKPEKRPFTPHLTVARFDPVVPVGDDLAAIEAASEVFGVRELVLYQSFLQRPAARYEPLRRFPLGA